MFVPVVFIFPQPTKVTKKYPNRKFMVLQTRMTTEQIIAASKEEPACYRIIKCQYASTLEAAEIMAETMIKKQF